jgi:hypothetical protein
MHHASVAGISRLGEKLYQFVMARRRSGAAAGGGLVADQVVNADAIATSRQQAAISPPFVFVIKDLQPKHNSAALDVALQVRRMPGDQPVAERGLQRGGAEFESRLQALRQGAGSAADQFATIRKWQPLQLQGAVAGGQDAMEAKTMAGTHDAIAATEFAQTRFNVLPGCKGGDGKTRCQTGGQALGRLSSGSASPDRIIASLRHHCDPGETALKVPQALAR